MDKEKKCSKDDVKDVVKDEVKGMKKDEVKNFEKGRLMGILSIVFGILSFILSLYPTRGLFLILLGIAAVVLGAIELDRVNKGLSEKK